MTTNPYGAPDSIAPHLDLYPDAPDFPTIKTEATERLHAGETDTTIESGGLTLTMRRCFYPAGKDGIHTPIFDKPLPSEAGMRLIMRRADGHEQEYDCSTWDWGDLDTEIGAFMGDWEHDAAQARTWAAQTQKRIRKLEAELIRAKQDRYHAVRAAHKAGITNYRIAKDLEASQPTIARILD